MSADISLINRIHDEATDLDQRLKKLTAFICSPNFERLPSRQQFLLGQQQLVMREYWTILALRIDDLVARPT